MCNYCDYFKLIYKQVERDTHPPVFSSTKRGHFYVKLINLFDFAYKQSWIRYAACDCHLDEAIAVLHSDKHYTVCHDLQCTHCNQLFFIGACIRGEPVFKLVNDIAEINTHSRWGKLGVLFENK